MKRNIRTHSSGSTMRIGGEVIDKINARYAYRCAECLGELRYKDNGLCCKERPEHHFFVHKREVPTIQALRDQEIADISQNYEIVDGLLKPKGELIR